MNEKTEDEESADEPASDGEILKFHEYSRIIGEENDYLKTLINAVSEGIAVYEKKRIVFANEPLVRITGYGHDELIGKDLLELFDYPCRQYTNANIISHNEKPYEAIVLRKDGTTFPVEVQGKAVAFRGRSLRVSTIRDISDRRQAQDLYQTMADNSQVGVYIIQGGKFCYLNSSTSIYTGYSPSELIGKYTISIIHPEDRKKAARNVSRMLKTGCVTPHVYRIITKNKEVKWMLERVSPITFSRKRAILSSTMDITEIIQARERLEELEQMEASILGAIPHAVIGQDHRRIIFANHAVKTVFGWKPEDIIGQKTRLFYRTEEDYRRVGEAFVSIYEERKTLFEEFPCIRRDGVEIVCRVSTSKIGDGEDRKVVVVYEDITERKYSEEKLLEYHEKLRNLASDLAMTEQKVRQRIATALHDGISQSLVVSKMRLKSLVEDMKETKYSESLMGIISIVEQALRDTRSLTLDLSPPILQILGLEPALEWLVEQFNDKYDITAELHIHKESIAVPTDKDINFLLFRGTQELLMNTVKHACADNVSVSVSHSDDEISVSVADDGVGFNPSKIDSTSLEGGYGLFSIRERLSSLGGSLEIESNPGRGVFVSMKIAPTVQRNYAKDN